MSSFLASIRQFTKETRGVALPLLCLMITVLAGTSGLAVDIARKQLVQSRLSQALDAAGLAAASTLSSADAQTEAEKYLKANFPDGYLGASSPSILVTTSADQSTVTISASVSMPTILMGIMGHHTMNTNVSTEIKRESNGIEVVMVLDNTGSMNDSGKMAALKTAAKAMVDTLYATGTSNIYVGIVPFGQTVNIGTNHANWLNPDYSPKNHWSWPSSDPWDGCVEARHWGTTSIGNANAPRTTGADLTDTPPDPTQEATLFWQYYYPCAEGSTYVGYRWKDNGTQCSWTCSYNGSYNANYTYDSTTGLCVCGTVYDENNICTTCPSNSKWDNTLLKCVCNSGYTKHPTKNQCDPNVVCATGSTYNSSLQKCTCNTGWADDGTGVCVQKCFGKNMKWDGTKCVCTYTAYYYESGSNCVAYCPEGSNIYQYRYNATYTGFCNCNIGYHFDHTTGTCKTGH